MTSISLRGACWEGSDWRVTVMSAICPLPCVQGRTGVGLHELAASFEFNARFASPHPNPLLLHVGEGADRATAKIQRKLEEQPA